MQLALHRSRLCDLVPARRRNLSAAMMGAAYSWRERALVLTKKRFEAW